MHNTVSKVLKRSVFPILHFGRHANGGAIAPPPPLATLLVADEDKQLETPLSILINFNLKFKSQAVHIKFSFANGSPSLHRFFQRSCVVRKRECNDP